MSRRLELKEQRLVDAMAGAEDDNNDDEVVEQLQWS